MTLPDNLGLAGTALSLFLSGAISSISLLTIPVVLIQSSSDSQALQFWKTIFDRGKIQGPVVATVAGVLHVSSSYLRSGSWREVSTTRWLAAGATAAIVPFTLLVMEPLANGALVRAATSGVGKAGTRELIERWRVLNLIRSVLPLVGGVLGLVSVRNGV